MTYTLRRYQSYQEYLDDDALSPDGHYRLLSTGEVIEVSGESEGNLWLAMVLVAALQQAEGISLIKLIRAGSKEIQVTPIGDRWVNRVPDIMILRPEHHQYARQAIMLGMPAPRFIAEVVSPGGESSESYLRDYVWKRQQYQEWQIPEYWILDPHREKITVLTLLEGEYQEVVYRDDAQIISTAFPTLKLTTVDLLTGNI